MVARECTYPFNINRLQGCNVEYIASANRYYIFEDYGPHFTLAFTPLTIILFHTWPVVIGTVSLYYCGEYPSSLLPFVVLAHWLQLGPFTRCISANVSSGSSWRLPKLLVLACTSA
jgi:hypothetical protein